MPKIKVSINLSVLLQLTSHASRARAGKPEDAMGFLTGIMKKGKNTVEIQVTDSQPGFEDEFMEKPFPRKAFVKGRTLAATMGKKRRKSKKGSPERKVNIIGWYHTHTRENASMSVMDKINHLSLQNIMVTDEEGQTQDTIEHMYQGAQKEETTGSGSNKEPSILEEGGIALIYSPSLFHKKAPFKKYLKIYAFAGNEAPDSVLLSGFTEVSGCSIKTDLDESMEFVCRISGKLPQDRQPTRTIATPKEAVTRKKPTAKKGGGWQKKPAAIPEKKTKKPDPAPPSSGPAKIRKLTRKRLQNYLSKEEKVKANIAAVQKMIDQGEDVARITTALKKARVSLDKLGTKLKEEMLPMENSTKPGEQALFLEAKRYLFALREQGAELDTMISKMYYKVLGDLSSKNGEEGKEEMELLSGADPR